MLLKLLLVFAFVVANSALTEDGNILFVIVKALALKCHSGPISELVII
jgi:hypothetical protein